ncbi:MAG: thrombospondin type 3 repeat-containing protein, partial [Candidatus Magasanikbacteria bacterium]|nr:thrombospondin type 3 repeat-containing protein [Candidatus Magasanikbacteria bacterium]
EPAAPLELKSALANKKLRPVGEESQSHAGLGSMPGNMKAMPEIEITPPLLSKKSVFVVIGVILIIGLGAATAWGIFKASKKEAPKNTIVNNVPVVIPPVVETPPINAVPEVAATTTQPIVTAPSIDTDGDGLSDEEEAKYGTDPLKVDTDGDTLTD